MTRPIVKIHDIATGEIIEREMNDAEFAQYEIDQTLVNELAAKAAARQTILDRLGLTADEAALLLGAN